MSINRVKDFFDKEPTANFIYKYSDEAKQQIHNILEKSNWDLLNIDESPKRVYKEWYTIDDISSPDLDDWLNAEKTKYWYRVEVSIADATEAIKPFTPLDLQAIEKSQSEYLSKKPEDIIHMLPNIFSTDLSSLNHNKKRLAKTIIIDLDHDCNIIDSEIVESVFYNKNRYDYESFNKDFNNPESKNYEKLKLFEEITLKLKVNNKKRGENTNLFKKESNNSLSNWTPQSIVEEFMKLSNTAANIFCQKKYYKGFS